jgi:ABC-type branched-subunit amino acid transport system ATPase component/branched-subunit amino acid ABC-type transport system permease component
VEEFVTYTIVGLASGAIYALIASGLTLSYTATGIFNFAYGAIAYVAAMIFYQLNTGLGWNRLVVAMLTVFVFCPLLGLLLNAAVFRPLASATDETKIMCTVGLLVALPALTNYIVLGGISTFGWDLRDPSLANLPPGIWRSPAKLHRWRDIFINDNQIIVFIVAAIVAVVLWYIMRRTRLGLRMRAVVDRPDLAALRGVDDARTSAVAWVIGTVLAGLAGVVGAPILQSLRIEVFTLTMFIAAAAVVFGRLRSVPLAYLGGLLLGVVQAWVSSYVPDSITKEIPGISNAVPFILLFAGLLWLARDRSRLGGVVTAQAPTADWTSDLPRWRVALPWVVAVGLFVIWTLYIFDNFWLGRMSIGLAFAVVFLSYVLVTGQGGMVSLAQAAFVTVAAMLVGRLMVMSGWPWGVALIAGVLAATVIGTIVALPALRVGGLPLALATLALGFVGDEILFKWNWLRRSQSGWLISQPKIGPFDLSDRRTFIFTMMIVIAVIVVVLRNLKGSASGREITAVRNSEPAASTSGLSIPRTKLSIFALSAAIAGLGGVLVATQNGGITNANFLTGSSLLWLSVVVLWGVRRPHSAVIAGVAFAATDPILNNGFHLAFLPSFLEWDGLGAVTATSISQLLFGLGAVQLAREPDGILNMVARQNRQRRDKWRARALGRAEVVVEELGHAPAAEPVTAAGPAPPAPRYIPPGDVVFELRDVRSGYGLVEVLRGIDLAVTAGHITALLGPNGAGKSTTCLTAAGRVTASAGAVFFKSEDITKVRAPKRAQMGIVLAPESRGIFPGLTVRENLELWLPSASDVHVVYERFPILHERRNVTGGNLSGGEQQILTLAPLLVNPPAVLIADEPSLGLAPLIVEQIMSLFVELKDRGTALLLVEEKARDLLDIADSVAIITLGRISWHGPRADVDPERVASEYLGVLA